VLQLPLEPALDAAVDSLDRRADAASGLILASYGPPHCDVSVDHAVPRTAAHVYFNSKEEWQPCYAH
jgi:hypothetical protein